ncbi:hypothetical protein HanRHA438_Chr01g0018921 [Helianthus annuus]|nr:hypothetical protein HanRHA438_Chr01g0018921 [Helianthus annuus]
MSNGLGQMLLYDLKRKTMKRLYRCDMKRRTINVYIVKVDMIKMDKNDRDQSRKV